jgi:hypothetical protein
MERSKNCEMNHNPNAQPESRYNYPNRLRAGLILLLLIALLSSRELLRLTSHGQAGGSEAVAYIQRFDAIKKILPERGVICYAPDPRIEVDTNKDYFLAQYALAPLVLRTNRDCDLLVANFPGGSTKVRISSPDYLLAKDFGNGVALFRKARQ